MAGFEDDASLLDGRVGVGGDADEGADRAEVFAACDGERDETGLGVAGFGELGSLGDVFGDGELGLQLFVEAEVLERLLGGKAVGRVGWVGDGEAREPQRLEGVE